MLEVIGILVVTSDIKPTLHNTETCWLTCQVSGALTRSLSSADLSNLTLRARYFHVAGKMVASPRLQSSSLE